MRPVPLLTSTLARAGLAALVLALAAPGVALAAGARTAPLFSSPSAVATSGAWVVVANKSGSTLTILHAADGSLAVRVGTTLLGVSQPDSVVAGVVSGHQVAFVAGLGGAVSELAIVPRAATAVIYKVRMLRAAGCAPWAATHLAADGAGHLVAACANGVVDEWAETSGMLLRQFGSKSTGLTNATALAMIGNNVYVTNAATRAPGSAPDGVVELSLNPPRHLRTVTNAKNPKYGFSSPQGIATDGTNLWVTNYAADTIVELTGATLAFVQSSSTNLYNPGAVIATKYLVWVASVNGPGSSMVTQFSTATPTQSPWMMCNSNDKYLYDNPSGFALGSGSLWVVNATDNVMDLMNSTTGHLVKTFS